MNARLWHPAWQGTADAVREGPAATAGTPRRARSCCCPATAVVRVIMPPTPARPHETEFLLCGHHHRASRQALATAHATVRPVPGTWDGNPDALLPGLPGPRMPAGQDQ